MEQQYYTQEYLEIILYSWWMLSLSGLLIIPLQHIMNFPEHGTAKHLKRKFSKKLDVPENKVSADMFFL